MKVLQIGSRGADVKKWQYFLTGAHFYNGLVNGNFDELTKSATIAFQTKNNLQPDGVVGNKTVGAAMLQGFAVINDDRDGKLSANWPPKPNFPPLVTNQEREAVFGKFRFKPKPLPDNPENIEVTDDWVKNNIAAVKIPQLVGVKGSPTVYFHRLGEKQLKKLWKDWEDADLLHLVLTWDGSYAPRFVRGSHTLLSNHSYGSAFDINFAWNKMGTIPALVGQKGSVRELVEIANDNGFYWGGHFTRMDGMHFEIAKLLK
jgi:D-alanyl-D-alanine carboxypeptidase/Putative peptidoglycan binding domain